MINDGFVSSKRCQILQIWQKSGILCHLVPRVKIIYVFAVKNACRLDCFIYLTFQHRFTISEHWPVCNSVIFKAYTSTNIRQITDLNM